MMNLNSTLPPTDPSELSKMLIALVELLSSPEEAKKRIASYSEAHAAASKQVSAAQRAMEELVKVKAATEAELADARASHDARVASDRSAFEKEASQRTAELDAREAHVGELLAKAKADQQEAQKLKETLARKLAILQAA